ncbi:HD domain-containing protein [Candidatus Kapabacteria bacterium]|nr:HD domain-containing protein [Candidatus Kapabacteria bacterium]
MLSKELIEHVFKAFSVERWNDKLRPIPLIQMDKHAHKMMIAYVLARYEEDIGNEFSWSDIIKGGIYELLRRSVISDIQSPVYEEIAKNKSLLSKLNYMIFKEVENKIPQKEIRDEFEQYLLDKDSLHPLSRKILDGAHRYSTYWEFQIIRHANPNGYSISDIEIQLGNQIESLSDLEGIRRLKKRHNIKNFVDLCGELRYQIRWGHLPRIPLTSVLGHSLMVAVVSYFLTKEISGASEKRIYNNFFCGLFHDLPEVVTRDIIKPVKRSVPGMREEIQKIERNLAEKEIYPHIRKSWVEEIKFFTQDEFRYKSGSKKFAKYNDFTEYIKTNDNPLDGPLIKAADEFSAFLEAYNSINYGIKSKELENAVSNLQYKYKESTISGLDISQLFALYK